MAFKPKDQQAPAETPSRSKYSPQKPPAQRGKRGRADYVNLCGMVPLEEARRFKANLALEGRDVSSVLEEMVRAYNKAREAA